MSRYLSASGGIFVDKKRKIIYDEYNLKFHKYSFIKLYLYYILLRKKPITEQYFNKYVPICDCINNGELPDIEYKKYENMYDIFKELFGYYPYIGIRGTYYKIACLNCYVCNDEYNLMLEEFNNINNKIKDKEHRENLLNKICK